MRGQHPDGFHLVVLEEVAFVDDQDGGSSPLCLFPGEGVGGLGDEGGGVEAGTPPRAATMWCRIPRTPTTGLAR